MPVDSGKFKIKFFYRQEISLNSRLKVPFTDTIGLNSRIQVENSSTISLNAVIGESHSTTLTLNAIVVFRDTESGKEPFAYASIKVPHGIAVAEVPVGKAVR